MDASSRDARASILLAAQSPIERPGDVEREGDNASARHRQNPDQQIHVTRPILMVLSS